MGRSVQPLHSVDPQRHRLPGTGSGSRHPAHWHRCLHCGRCQAHSARPLCPARSLLLGSNGGQALSQPHLPLPLRAQPLPGPAWTLPQTLTPRPAHGPAFFPASAPPKALKPLVALGSSGPGSATSGLTTPNLNSAGSTDATSSLALWFCLHALPDVPPVSARSPAPGPRSPVKRGRQTQV